MYSSTFQEVTIHQQIIRHGRLVRSNARRVVVGIDIRKETQTGILYDTSILYHPSGNRRSIELRRRGAETAARCGGLSLEDRILRESAKANLPLTLAPPEHPVENCRGAWAVVANHLGRAYFPDGI
jgi:hypothetical protein